jgi:hypothetical protein
VKPVIIHSQARAELDEAIAFYEQQRAGWGWICKLSSSEPSEGFNRTCNSGHHTMPLSFATMSCDVSRTSSSMRSGKRPSGLSRLHMGSAGQITGEGGGLNEVSQASGLTSGYRDRKGQRPVCTSLAQSKVTDSARARR